MGTFEVWFPDPPEVPAEEFDTTDALRAHLLDRHGIEFGPGCSPDTLRLFHHEAHQVANSGPVRLKV